MTSVSSSWDGLYIRSRAFQGARSQIAKNKAADLRLFSISGAGYLHRNALDKALGRYFDAKVKFAKIEGDLSNELAQTFVILHGYRNEVYHVGLTHESILPALAEFYFDAACSYLSRYRSRGLSWGLGRQLPERVTKYFSARHCMPGGIDDFAKGCDSLRTTSNFDASRMIATLADEMDAVIGHQDTCIDVIAGGVYQGQQTTRDEAVLKTQAWALAFSKEGKAFAGTRGWTGHPLQLVEWLSLNYQFTYRSDPIPSWEAQAARVRANKNPHLALSHFHSFMASTSMLREALEQSAAAAELEIEAAMERARGN